MKVQIPITFKVDIDAKDLREYLLTMERMKPAVFWIPCSYAPYLEFGTHSAQQSSYGELERELRLWVRRKLGISDPKEIERKVKQIHGNIVRHGLAPRPFWRPAFYYTVDHLQELFDQGYSMLQIAEDMAERTNENIMWNTNAPPGREYMPYNGTLQMGWIVRYLTEEEAQGAKTKAEDVRAISDRIWNEKEPRT